MPNGAPDPSPEVLATVDTRGSSLVLAAVGVCFMCLGAGAAYEGVYLFTVVFGLPGFLLALLTAGAVRRLVLTARDISLHAKTSTFARDTQLWSIPLTELGKVRSWTEQRKPSGNSNYHTVRIISVLDRKGSGYRMTAQLISGKQLAALQRALESRGFQLELLERPPR
jgi:hypothetical protein